jgi:hypothetical protein
MEGIMSILDRAKIDRTQEFATRQPTAFLSAHNIGEDATFPSRTEFAVRLTVEARFLANQAQYGDGLKSASTVLLHTLYGESLSLLDSATHEIFNGDTEKALKYLALLRKEILGD